MQGTKLERFKKTFRILISTFLLVFTLYSLFYIAHEAHHECSGEDCPICYVIFTAKQNIKLLAFGLAAIAASRSIKNLPLQNIVVYSKSVPNPNTLVIQKIRLND